MNPEEIAAIDNEDVTATSASKEETQDLDKKEEGDTEDKAADDLSLNPEEIAAIDNENVSATSASKEGTQDLDKQEDVKKNKD